MCTKLMYIIQLDTVMDWMFVSSQNQLIEALAPDVMVLRALGGN
jgi:hypothetical protein